MVARGKRLSGTLWSSFGFAFRGLKEAFGAERNFRIQCLYAFVVCCVLLWLRPHSAYTLIVIIAMVLLLSCELFNSAIERTVDLASDGFHPLAGLAKDLSASAVLLIAAMTACVNIWVIGTLTDLASQLAFAALMAAFLLRRFAGGGSR